MLGDNQPDVFHWRCVFNLINFDFEPIWTISETVSRIGDGIISCPYRNTCNNVKPHCVTIVNIERSDRLVLYISSAPVEEKGFKRIINSLDWVNNHN